MKEKVLASPFYKCKNLSEVKQIAEHHMGFHDSNPGQSFF
jgi:hypothetical protein